VPAGAQVESEQRVTIAAADELEQRARELIQPEQHALGGEQDEPERRVANAAVAEPGGAPFEPGQHATANEQARAARRHHHRRRAGQRAG